MDGNVPDGTENRLDVLSRGRGVAALLEHEVAADTKDFRSVCSSEPSQENKWTYAAMYFIVTVASRGFFVQRLTYIRILRSSCKNQKNKRTLSKAFKRRAALRLGTKIQTGDKQQRE